MNDYLSLDTMPVNASFIEINKCFLFQPSIANATNIDTLLVATEKEEKMTAPPEALQDKVAFIFNNLSQLNLQTKVSILHTTFSLFIIY